MYNSTKVLAYHVDVVFTEKRDEPVAPQPPDDTPPDDAAPDGAAPGDAVPDEPAKVADNSVNKSFNSTNLLLFRCDSQSNTNLCSVKQHGPRILWLLFCRMYYR